MELSNNDGIALSFSVSGYQFPTMETEFHDSNWLSIVGKVRHPRGDWSFHDPCLLTYELARLCTWLDGVAEAPGAKHNAQYFTEPNLEFSVARVDDAPVLRVHLSHEACPPWVSDRDERFDGVDLDFPLAENDLRSVAEALRELLVKFPQRADS